MHNCGDGLTPKPYVCAQNKEYIPIEHMSRQKNSHLQRTLLCVARAFVHANHARCNSGVARVPAAYFHVCRTNSMRYELSTKRPYRHAGYRRDAGEVEIVATACV